MTKTIEEINSGKAIDEIIKRVSRTQEAFALRVHKAAIMIVEHAQNYGDCLRAAKLCRAVNGHQRNSLVSWFKHVSPINVIMAKTAKDDNARYFKEDSKQRCEFNLDMAKDIRWDEDHWGENPEPKALEEHSGFWTGLENFLAKAVKDSKKEDDKAKYTEADRALVLASAENVLKVVRRMRAMELAAMAASRNGEAQQDQDGGDLVPEPLLKIA